ncbi:hypothetical protein JCM3770_005661 [Rhodotorula araucariae]
MNRLKQSLASLPTPSIPSFTSSSSPTDRPTPPPLDHERLDALAAQRAVAADVLETFALHVRTLGKQRANPVQGTGNAADLSSRWVGEALCAGAEALTDGLRRGTSPEQAYAHVLTATGDLYLRHTHLATAYHDQLNAGFLDTLERRTEDHKDFERALKDAEKKRTALESLMNKMDKGKKDPSEYERDLDNAEEIYADECRRLQRKADRLEAALETDVAALKQLVEVQLEYARGYVSLLEDCQSAIEKVPSSSSSRSRSASLQVPPASTRMSRSQSESSIHAPAVPTSSAGVFSILGPNRSRRSTVSSQTSDGASAEPPKNRSRSGSMLERFAIGNKSKKKDVSPADSPAAEQADPYGEPVDAQAGTGSPSRFAPSMPSLPTLGSLKKLSLSSGGGGGGGKYGSLGEEDAGTVSPTSSTSSSLSRRLPPALKRTHTAPAMSSTSPSPPPRRTVAPPLLARSTPVGRMYRAQWAYVPGREDASADGHSDADTDTDTGGGGGDGELALARGDVIRVESEVNADWWIGTARDGRRGMFPSAYVVPHDEPPSAAGAGADEAARWTTFGNELATFSFAPSSAHGRDVPDHDGGGAETASDSDGEGAHGLLGGGRQDRTTSPFRDAVRSPSARRTAPPPPPPQSRSRGSTVTAGAGASSPFADDGVSHARASGQMSRR